MTLRILSYFLAMVFGAIVTSLVLTGYNERRVSKAITLKTQEVDSLEKKVKSLEAEKTKLKTVVTEKYKDGQIIKRQTKVVDEAEKKTSPQPPQPPVVPTPISLPLKKSWWRYEKSGPTISFLYGGRMGGVELDFQETSEF